MYKVNGELSSCDITYSGRVPSREGDIHNFAVGFVKLLSTHPVHIVVWGNFPFKIRYILFLHCILDNKLHSLERLI